MAHDYHFVHLGRFALGGAGVVIAEATAVESRGRISSSDLGIWSDDHVDGLSRLARFLKAYGAVPGIQLSHAGRKAAVQPPWCGNRPLSAKDAVIGDPPWPVVGPSAIAAGPDRQVPTALTVQEIRELVCAWADAAKRATDAGFEVIDLHGAHGYLLHSFFSPLSNVRTDEYGGSGESRMRFALEVVDAVRAVVPESTALFYRMSVIDGIEGGVTMADSMEFAKILYQRGVDLIDVSSGGLVSDRSVDTRVSRGFAFHAGYSEEIKRATGGQVGTVGLVVDARQAEAILRRGQADLVFLARQMLIDPNWALHARAILEGENFADWHQEAGWWLERRQPHLEALSASGVTPMAGYELHLGSVES